MVRAQPESAPEPAVGPPSGPTEGDEHPLLAEPDGSDIGDLALLFIVLGAVVLLIVFVWLFLAYVEGALRGSG